MKVLQVIEALTRGGAERLVFELSKELTRRGAECRILCLSAPGTWAEAARGEGLYAGCIGKSQGVDFAALRRLKRRIEELSPDVVQSHLFTANLWTRLAALPSRRWRLIATLHDIDLWRGPVHWTADLVLAGVADRYVCVSAAVRDYYRSHGIGELRLRTIPNGISWNGAKCSVPFEREVPVVRACGRLVPKKGFIFLVGAAAILRAKGLRFRVEIVGEGPEEASLREAIEARGLEGQVVLLGARDDARELIADADAFVLPSLREGLPLVILEALHAGRPVVATNIAALAGVVHDGQEALMVRPGSAESLAEGIERLLADPVGARCLGRIGRARAQQDFTMSRMASSYMDLYNELVPEKRHDLHPVP